MEWFSLVGDILYFGSAGVVAFLITILAFSALPFLGWLLAETRQVLKEMWELARKSINST